MSTLDEIVTNAVSKIETGRPLSETIRNACSLYARSIVPEAEKMCNHPEHVREDHLQQMIGYNDCRTEILNKLDEAEKSL